MNGFRSFCLVLLVAGGATAGGPARKGKNLRGTFPFNQANGRAASNAAHEHHHHDHAHHDDHAHAHEDVPARGSRQRGGETMSPLTLGLSLLLERGVLTRLSWLRRLNMMMLLSASTPTARSVTRLTQLTLSLSKKRNVRK